MAGSRNTTNVSPAQVLKAALPDTKPTLQASFNVFDTPFKVACHGNDITGNVTGEMLRFLKTEDLSPYYRMKACIVMSATDELDEMHENLSSTKYWLKKAKEALEDAKRAYTHEPDDARQLGVYEKMIKDEEEELREREKAFNSDDDDNDGEADY